MPLCFVNVSVMGLIYLLNNWSSLKVKWKIGLSVLLIILTGEKFIMNLANLISFPLLVASIYSPLYVRVVKEFISSHQLRREGHLTPDLSEKRSFPAGNTIMAENC